MLGIVNLQGQYSVAWGVQGSLSLIASLPTLIVFLFFQRYFIKGMTMGAVKGLTMAELALHGVSKRFGSVLAVDGVDLAIAHGEFVVLVGPSGCGKSTTAADDFGGWRA